MASKEQLKTIYDLLNQVTKSKVYYALFADENIRPPFIVYQEISKRNKTYVDDYYLIKTTTIQITLVTKDKDIAIQEKLETVLTNNNIEYQMINEYHLTDTGLYTIYEIKMEEFKNEQ